MDGSLLARRANLERPPMGPGLVRRPKLFERLSGSARVMLLCAPAGSGKSVLLGSWIEAEGLGERAAWVSVERGERDPQRFWLSVIDGLARGTAGGRVVQPATPAPDFRGRAVVEGLLGDLGSLDEPLVLVIDDLHELQSADALGWLELFLARLPSNVRVLLSTREDPGLGLHRLRLTDEVTEIRDRDLRFSLEETRELPATITRIV